jgi:hypothetical protein
MKMNGKSSLKSKNMASKFLLKSLPLLLLLANATAAFAQFEERLDPDKCYGQAMLPPTIETEEVTYPESLGGEGQPFTKTIELQIVPAHQTWEYKIKPGCQSFDPRACAMLCMVEKPALFQKLVMVTDTFQNKEFELVTFTLQTKITHNGATMVEIVCNEYLTSAFLQKIADSLAAKDYQVPKDQITTVTVIEALQQFQIENNLPTRQFDIETMKLLGIPSANLSERK